MKNLARGSVALTITALLVISFYFQRKVEAVSIVAIDSQNEIQELKKEIERLQEEQKLQDQQTQDRQKQDKQTPDKQIQDDQNITSNKPSNKETITVTIENLDEKNATAAVSESAARAFTATAYCLRGRTATGGSVRRGIVAADPRVLPLGTRINLNAGAYSGTYVVADTGGAVKGRKLDIWVPSCAEAKRFGRRSVRVSVLGKKK
jgi:3D (Asp-Asp-Asp) domain-containing protein